MPEDEFSDEHTIVGDRQQLVMPIGQKRDQAYVIVIAGPNVGEMFKIERSVFIGRGTEAEVRMNDSEISRKHCRLVRTATSVVLEDLGSTNGTFVNGAAVDLQELKDGDKIQVGTTTVLKFSYHGDLEEQFQRQMYESALRDGLTGAYNKKYFQDRLTSEVAYALRHGLPLSLILLDLDHFKLVNDTHGHLAGDHVLASFAEIVAESIRKEDIFARYGGEEFALISRGLGREAGFQFAERIREAVAEGRYLFEGKAMDVTVSIGVAALPLESVKTANELIAAADKALYEAKHCGRNQSKLYERGLSEAPSALRDEPTNPDEPLPSASGGDDEAGEREETTATGELAHLSDESAPE